MHNDTGKAFPVYAGKSQFYVIGRDEFLEMNEEIEMLKEIQAIRKECPEYEDIYREQFMTPIPSQKVEIIKTDTRIPDCIEKPHKYMVFW